MVLLDTNVVAELMKPAPEPAVVSWMNSQGTSSLFLTAIAVGEILYCIRILPQGKRRLGLEQGFERILAEAFAGRDLAFDVSAARHYGGVRVRRREIGRPLNVPDGQVA